MTKNNFLLRVSALLTVSEVLIGSVLHALHFPLTGHILSLNQGFLLSLSLAKTRQKTDVIKISLVAALLKSFSPAGKKLTPMLALSIQGLLFYLPLVVLGANFFGALVGSALLSLWAFAQPVAIAWLLLGEKLVPMLSFYLQKSVDIFKIREELFLYALGFLVLFKIFISAILTVLAFVLSDESVVLYERKLKSWGQSLVKVSIPQHATKTDAAKGALKDLLQPWVLVSIVFSSVFFYYSEHEQFSWWLLRVPASAFALFFAIRATPMNKLYQYLASSRSPALRKLSELVKLSAQELDSKYDFEKSPA